ncbi:MAG: T9SS type A sorting domain-containing protein [Saprospiraceae bacterium]
MRFFLLLLSFLISVPVFSQNYRTVLTDSEVYYDFQSVYAWDETYRMIKPDSITVVSNDTIVHHQFNFQFRQEATYDSIIQNYNYCYISADTGFLGYKTILQADGMDIYFNNNDDSIFINTTANLNDTWAFYTYNNGNYFEAKVTEHKTETFLGLTDSVKVITIQAMDILGNSIFGNNENVELTISKNYGIIKGFSLFEFPFYTNIQNFDNYFSGSINIEGIQHLGVGVNDFTAADVYDFDNGDEFHRVRFSYYNSSGQPTYLIDQIYTKMFINSKSYSINNDTVFYDITLHKVSYNSGETFLDTIYWGDTTIFYDISPNHFLNTKTLNYSTEDTTLVVLNLANFFPFYRNKLAKIISSRSGINEINGCPILTSPGLGYGTNLFYKGLGSEWYYNDFLYSASKELVYYKKGNIQNGIPINFDNIVSTKSIKENNFPLKVFPNPTNNLLNFQFTEPINNTEIRIYSSIGQLILNQNVTDTNIQFNVSDWTKGVYFYGIYVEGEIVKQGQVLIKN